MEDVNLHILMFSVLLACVQSFSHLRQTVKEPICEDHRADSPTDRIWSTFENHKELPGGEEDVDPSFHLCHRGEGLTLLVVLIHGFNSKKSAWAASMSEKILSGDKRDNLGILTVDWRRGAGMKGWWDFDVVSAYNRAAANTRYIGAVTQRFIRDLEKKQDSKVRVHCIGHSLGAQACGFLGNEIEQETKEKMWRITGLDPAGPLFTTEPISEDNPLIFKPLTHTPEDQRLDSSDAELVDVIHTDGDQWGTMHTLGDVDFYVGNSFKTLGHVQADCDSSDMCDHSKATTLFHHSLDKRQEFETMVSCDVSREMEVERCEDIAVWPTFGYFYQSTEPAGVIGVVEKNKMKEEDDDWWKFDDEIPASSTPQPTTSTQTTSPIDDETSTTGRNLSLVEEKSIPLRGLSQRTLIIIGGFSSCLVFILICCLILFTLYRRKPKSIPVPETVDPLLSC